jgi:hypothetical protein
MVNRNVKAMHDTECFTDLDNLNLVKFASEGLVLGPSQFSQFLTASKNNAPFKSDQKRLENNHLVTLI